MDLKYKFHLRSQKNGRHLPTRQIRLGVCGITGNLQQCFRSEEDHQSHLLLLN
jgi:hypothetical protein